MQYTKMLNVIFLLQYPLNDLNQSFFRKYFKVCFILTNVFILRNKIHTKTANFKYNQFYQDIIFLKHPGSETEIIITFLFYLLTQCFRIFALELKRIFRSYLIQSLTKHCTVPSTIGLWAVVFITWNIVSYTSLMFGNLISQSYLFHCDSDLDF